MGKELVNVLLGIVLTVVGVAWYVVRVPFLGDLLEAGKLVPFWRSFLVLFAASFGALLIFIGVILAWMGIEDYRNR
ncbi:MAG: hypothetical protein GXO65_00095 [Euryarchaeota archaeon]|nr:hypothetical protein [Euryarchaeota archaeon]